MDLTNNREYIRLQWKELLGYCMCGNLNSKEIDNGRGLLIIRKKQSY